MKIEEIREKTVEELKQAAVDCKKQLFELRLQKSMHKLENTAQIGNVKRDIARIKTVIRQKEQ
ncbi:MAG: 50S ribosomal protein L29 [Candidatus Gastranaerophilaceae bacterium]